MHEGVGARGGRRDARIDGVGQREGTEEIRGVDERERGAGDGDLDGKG